MSGKNTSGVIAEFLGKGADIGGPFALLGLRHEPIDDEMILSACRRRLEKIAEHRRANTPAADEARMAVHTAASQLLDPQLREELARHWPMGTPEVDGESPDAWKDEQAGRLDGRLRSQALMLLGACGGWNARSRKRLGQFARLHRLPAAQLVAGIVGEKNDQVGPGSLDMRRPIQGPSLIDPSDGALPWAMIPIAYVLMGLALIWAGYAKYDRFQESSGTLAGTVLEPPGGEERSVGSRLTESKLSSRRHYSAILFELEQTRREGVFDVESGERFSELGTRLGEQWTEFGREDLGRAVEAVESVFAGILNSEVLSAASGFLVDDGDGPEPAIHRALRMLLSGNADQVPEFGNLAGGEFEPALFTGFAAAARLSTDDPAWWSWWIGQLEPIKERDVYFHASVFLDAVYGRLIDESMDADGWKKSVRLIVQNLDWNGELGVGSRAWLMGVVVDPLVRSDRLAELTHAMVVHSSAGGLGLDMVVDASASMVEREEYLRLLREQWVPGEGDSIYIQLVEQLELMLKLTSGKMTRAQAIDRAAELGRVNSACWARARDDEGMAMMLIDSFDTPAGASASGGGGDVIDFSSSDADEQWATDARNLEATADLVAHLDGLHRVDPIGPKSAHALVYLAMQAPDLEVRGRAERVLLGRRDEAAILIALDRIAADQRLTRRMKGLILSYLGAEDRNVDQDSVRRMLLKQMASIGVLGGVEMTTEIDAFEHAMNGVFVIRAGSEETQGARGVYESMVLDRLIDGRDVSEEVRAKLLVRLRVSRGGAQRSLAYQSAAMELFAGDIRMRFPVHQGRVDRVFEEHALAMRGTSDVFVQMTLIERALAELWLIALESEGMS